jgi:dihydrofolate reductase
MRKLIVSEFISIDGVIQAPGGKDEDTEGGFEHGGWTWPYWDDAIGDHFGQVMGDVDTLLLGRKTWQIHGAAFEPMADDDPNEPGFNKLQKYVVSTTLPDASAWRNSTLISGDVVEAVRALKAQPGQNIAMDGSSVLVQTLAENDLIDDYYLLVYPVVLGSGKKIFPEGKRLNLRLVEAKPLASGVIVTHYTVDRPE